MSVNPRIRDVIRQSWPKRQPRQPKAKNPGESATRKLLAIRSGGVCEVCGAFPAESVHHRRKRSQGGLWSASNCVAICGDGVRSCHGWVEHNPNAAEAWGFHLRPGQEAALTPIKSGLHDRVLLADDGSISPAPIEGGAA